MFNIFFYIALAVTLTIGIIIFILVRKRKRKGSDSTEMLAARLEELEKLQCEHIFLEEPLPIVTSVTKGAITSFDEKKVFGKYIAESKVMEYRISFANNDYVFAVRREPFLSNDFTEEMNPNEVYFLENGEGFKLAPNYQDILFIRKRDK